MNSEHNTITTEDLQKAGKVLRAIAILFVKTLANTYDEVNRRTIEIEAESVHYGTVTTARLDVVKAAPLRSTRPDSEFWPSLR